MIFINFLEDLIKYAIFEFVQFQEAVTCLQQSHEFITIESRFRFYVIFGEISPA
jgi:hypothetical protein